MIQAWRSKNPGAILHKGVKLEVHSTPSVRILVGNGKARGFNSVGFRVSFGNEGFGYGVSNGAVGEVFGLGELVFGSGGHGMGRILVMCLSR